MHRCGLAAEVSKLNFLDGLETMFEIFETQERMTAGKVGALPVPSSANTVLFAKMKLLTFPGVTIMRNMVKVSLLCLYSTFLSDTCVCGRT